MNPVKGNHFWFHKTLSLYKIFNSSVNCCKYTKEGKDNSKNRSMPTCKFIKFYATPDCKKNNSNHLKCQT